MDPFKNDELRIDVHPTAELVRVVWSGTSAARNPGDALLPYFVRIASLATTTGARVELDLATLTYCNSATLGAIVAMTRLLTDSKLHVAIVYDGGSDWQRRSFGALRVLQKQSGGLVEIRAAAPQAGPSLA